MNEKLIDGFRFYKSTKLLRNYYLLCFGVVSKKEILLLSNDISA